MIFSHKKSFQLTHGLVKNLKPFDAFIFYLLAFSLIASFFFVLAQINEKLSVAIPISTGSIHEGVVGIPTTFNPLLATSTLDQDVTTLLYAGLLKPNNDGTFSGNLATEWRVSDDGLSYFFSLHPNALFHDGTPVTGDDFFQTIERIQHPETESPLAPIWKDVTVQVSGNDIQVILPELRREFPYAFTVGVLPYQTWKKVPHGETNLYRGSGAFIGAGPFQYDGLEQTLDNRPIALRLKRFPDYVLGGPFITHYVFHFFDDVSKLLGAFNTNTINAITGPSTPELTDLLLISETPHSVFSLNTHRLFNITFNVEDGKLLNNPFLRSILIERVDRERIINGVFAGFARAIENPWPGDETKDDQLANLEEISNTLDTIGWKFDSVKQVRTKDDVPFELTLLIPDLKEFQRVAEVITNDWSNLGITTTITEVPLDEIVPAIKGGNFDAFFYGYNAPTPKALYDFWHSASPESLAALAHFGNERINTLLEELRASIDTKTEKMIYNEIKEEMVRLAPAIFLFSPDLVYLLPFGINGVERVSDTPKKTVVQASDRFTDVHTWYIHTENVWNIFINE